MLNTVFFLMCLLHLQHTVLGTPVTPKPIIINGSYVNPELGKYHARLRSLARSCLEIREKNPAAQDGMYILTTASGSYYQAFCDMSSAGGGWTLVASVHENNIKGRCSVGDRWSSQQGNDQSQPEGDGAWANTATFGSAEGSTSDDYKNPGYYDISARDVSVWHIPNNQQLENWTSSAILRYHTESQFLSEHGGNLYHLFKKYPVRFGAGQCQSDVGAVSPVVYDTGDKDSTAVLYGPSTQDEFESGFITFRVFNADRAALALCSGVRPTQCNPQHYCIGGGGFFPQRDQCGDFTALDLSDTKREASKLLTESAVLLFYR
ncbi:LOW QUALITY PROTEIN: intelectin 3 [Pseudorasbora parva]|uniref:LOW QUALITY PROTEIN: intelectin 3 n=1 Tax=Pseudorasbora parva TaxID=51549 RepID=UPI00351E612C